MNEQETVEAIAVPVEAKLKKTKAKDKPKVRAKEKSRAKTKHEKKGKASQAKPPKPAHDFDFIGKVEILRVRSGAGAEGFEFGLRGRHGKHRRFRFDPADAFAMNAMAHLVLAAHAGDTKLGVRTAAEVDGVLVVRELENRPKLGK